MSSTVFVKDNNTKWSSFKFPTISRGRTFQLLKKSPNFERREYLARPTVWRLLANGFHALRTRNEKTLRNLEQMLCHSLRETVDPCMSPEEWQDYIRKFVAYHRPKSPVDPDKFEFEDLDDPVFYETYQRCRSHMIHRNRIYNYRGVPKPINAKVLNYEPSERIVELSRPRPNARYILDRSNTSLKLRTFATQKYRSPEAFFQNERKRQYLQEQQLAVAGTTLHKTYLENYKSESLPYGPQPQGTYQSLLPDPRLHDPSSESVYNYEMSPPVVAAPQPMLNQSIQVQRATLYQKPQLLPKLKPISSAIMVHKYSGLKQLPNQVIPAVLPGQRLSIPSNSLQNDVTNESNLSGNISPQIRMINGGTDHGANSILPNQTSAATKRSIAIQCNCKWITN